MAGRHVVNRGILDDEFGRLAEALEIENPVLRLEELRRRMDQVCIRKYNSGYQCGYKRASRGSSKDHFDEDQR